LAHYRSRNGPTDFAEEAYDLAIEQYRKTIELHPYFIPTYLLLGSALLAQSMLAEAIVVFQKAVDLSGYKMAIACLGAACAMSGQADKARDRLTELQGMSESEYVPPFAFFVLNLSMGRVEEAFQWLETAFQQRDSNLLLFRVLLAYEALSSHPRFKDLLCRMNLAQ